MRDAPYLHAKHLDEAVRQQVITSEQREALDALARTMKPDGGRALPELAWFRGMLAAVVAGTVGFFGLYALNRVRWMHANDALAAGLLAVGACAGVAVTLRNRREHVMVKGILAAGATAFAWLLGAGAGLKAFGLFPYAPLGTEPRISGDQSIQQLLQIHESDQSHDYNLPLWTIPGDLTVLVTALVLGRWLRAPTVLLPAALALAHAVVRVGTYLHVTRPYQRGSLVDWGRDAQLPWWLGASLVLVVAARLLDWRFRRGSDPAFWVHLVAPGAALLGVLQCVRWAPGALAAALTLAWCALFGLAFLWRRVAWIAWGALGLATIPVVSTSHSDPHAVLALAVWIPLCVGAFAFVATVWRRHMLATTPADGDERLPWG